MKQTKKIIAAILALVMCVGLLAGCNAKKEPADLFFGAIDTYRDAVQNDKVVKILTNALQNGSAGIKVEQDENVLDAKLYFDSVKNEVAMQMDVKAEGEEFDATVLLSKTKVVIGTSLLSKAYGLNLAEAKDNFKTSIFGTEGGNLFGLDEEDEKELLDAIGELSDAMQKDVKTVDFYKIITDALKANAEFAADTKTPYTINGKAVKNTTVTASITKNDVKAIVADVINKAGLKEAIDAALEEYNAQAEMEAEWFETEAKTYPSVNDVLNEVFKDYGDEDVVLTIKLVLDKKHDAIMAAEIKSGENYLNIVLGDNPAEIKAIDVTSKIDGEKTHVQITINKSSTEYTLKALEVDERDGIVLNINKAHKTITLTPIVDEAEKAEEAISLGYDLTDKSVSLIIENDDAGELTTLTSDAKIVLTFTMDDKSPITEGEYIDLLKMTEEEFNKLMEELAPFLEDMEGPGYDDEWDDEWDDDFTIDTEEDTTNTETNTEL